ncbi:hypothetical protein GCM10020255_009320 [Rhodococcus baikonurensis]
MDWQGTMRAFLTNTTTGQVEQGASTIDQQYVKNYLLHVVAKTDAERRDAIETTPARKVREIRMALSLDKQLTKDEILTRYLNLVPFGNGAFGVQDAARTYFGVDAKDLTVAQSAMLAGMVQSNSTLNPYANPGGVRDRRNVVLDTMMTNIPERADEIRGLKEAPLGMLPSPASCPAGASPPRTADSSATTRCAISRTPDCPGTRSTRAATRSGRPSIRWSRLR